MNNLEKQKTNKRRGNAHNTATLHIRYIAISCIFIFFILLSSFSVFSQCLPSNKNVRLEVNNISALFKTNGAHFFREKAEFEVPKGSGKTSFFAGSLWLGGKDEQNELHLAAMTYGMRGKDYWVGPVSNAEGSALTYYDKFWDITKAEIEYHIQHYATPGYTVSEKIASWPANGRSEYGESSRLAPYVSVSGNSTYTPEEGDYPLIRGDHAIFWINNDKCTHTESKGKSLEVEIMSMAYGYDSPTYELKHTIFISYQIRNKSANNYKDFYIGFFADFDIGYGDDDYIGCDPDLNLAYGYNGNEIDGSGQPQAYGANPPAQGVMFLNQKMNAFMYMKNSDPGPMGDPSEPEQFYNFMQAKWKDGTPLTLWGSGYEPESTEYTHFAFAGNPVDETGWTEITPNGSGSEPDLPGDRRGLLSAGPFTLSAGESICIDIALPYTRDLEEDNISIVALLKQNTQAIQQFYNNQNYTSWCAGGIGMKEHASNSENIQIFPNPTTGALRISMNNEPLIMNNVEVFDVFGKKLLSHTVNCSPFTVLDISDLARGIYFIKIVTDSGEVVRKVVKQ